MPKKVLIVEDDESFAEILRLVLNFRGDDFAIAENGSEAIHLASNEVFDVCVIDYKLPGIDQVLNVTRN